MLKYLVAHISRRTLPQRKLKDNMGLRLIRHSGQSLMILRIDDQGQVKEEVKIKISKSTPSNVELFVEGDLQNIVILREEIYDNYKKNPEKSLAHIGRKRSRPEQSMAVSLQEHGVTRERAEKFLEQSQGRDEGKKLRDFVTAFLPGDEDKEILPILKNT